MCDDCAAECHDPANRRFHESRGFTVLTHSRVPCNDGGISLGQAVVAAAREPR